MERENLTHFIPDTVIQEFKELNKDDIVKILTQYYNFNAQNQLIMFLGRDAKMNFTNKPELICRIIRKHLGQPEQPGVTLYPESEIDAEINRRIGIMVKARVDRKRYPKSEIGIRKNILKTALAKSNPRDFSEKDLNIEIEKRCKLTGLSKEEVIKKLYCAFFNIGIK